MKRRHFLKLAGGLTTYSLVIKAGPLHGEPLPDRDQLSRHFDAVAPPNPTERRTGTEPHMTLVDLTGDVFIAGGGMAGVCAALSAARNGAKVILAQDRSRLGGNASSEVKMHIVGADHHGGRPGWREGGLIEELRLDDAVNNPQRSFELWDLLLYQKVMAEPNITLLLDSVLFAATAKAGLIQQVLVRCDKTEHLYRIAAKVFLDCTGDSRLALEAGAEFRVGRESKTEFGESLGLDAPDRQTLGSSLLFTARNYGRPIPFSPPPWARKITKDQLRFRPINSWEYGYWWIEWGGQLDTIRDNERIRFELLSIILGAWDYIKNSGNHPDSANWGMDWVGLVPGKRESRRILGDHVLTQNNLLGQTGGFEDAVAIGGWPIDDHPPSGFDRWEEPPFTQVKTPEVYEIPLRSLYSRTIGNLMMAGRNISASHVALASTRVMATCSVLGQAAGAAAALCARHGLMPRQLSQEKTRLRELQQILLRDDQTLKVLRNEDPLDLARQAHVTASDSHELSRPEHVISGFVRDLGNEWKNRWAARMKAEGVWLDLAWDQPQRISQVQITFDTGFQRELTLSASDSVTRKMVRGPQPETVRDYEVVATDSANRQVSLVKVTGNHQRLRRHRFTPIEAKSIRLHVTATNGDRLARVYEVRCYA